MYEATQKCLHLHVGSSAVPVGLTLEWSTESHRKNTVNDEQTWMWAVFPWEIILILPLLKDRDGNYSDTLISENWIVTLLIFPYLYDFSLGLWVKSCIAEVFVLDETCHVCLFMWRQIVRETAKQMSMPKPPKNIWRRQFQAVQRAQLKNTYEWNALQGGHYFQPRNRPWAWTREGWI